MKISFLLVAIFVTSSCFASETDTAIHTYGGGPLLEKVFNAIAMILYGDAQSGIGKHEQCYFCGCGSRSGDYQRTLSQYGTAVG
jgi:hypothetical protein